MTRQEAIDKLLPVCEPRNNGPYTLESHLSSGAFVDSLVALGLLKLEEAPTPFMRLLAALEGSPASSYGNPILEALEQAGLKLVDK